MRRFSGSVFAFLIVTSTLAAVAAATVPQQQDCTGPGVRQPLLLGYVTSRSPTSDRTDPAFNTIAGKIIDMGGVDPPPVDLVEGNSYQIRYWFEEGRIDGVVVPGFLAALLVKNWPSSSREALYGRPITGNSATYAIGVSGGDATLANFERALAALQTFVQDPDPDDTKRDSLPRIALINHLSGSGFYAPLKLASAWCGGECTAEFWAEFQEIRSLQIFHQDTPKRDSISFSTSLRQTDLASESKLPYPWTTIPRSGPIGEHHYTLPADHYFLLTRGKVFPETSTTDRIKHLGPWTKAVDFVKNLPPSLAAPYAPATRAQKAHTRYNYDFNLEDVMEIIRLDHETGDHLTIVLPGGGVKSAFQAGVLDELYGSHLTNKPPEHRESQELETTKNSGASERGECKELLHVSHITGTSGGALVGFFASQQTTTSSLKSIWKINGDWITMSDVYSRYFSVPAFLSALVVLLVCLAFIWMFAGRRVSGSTGPSDPEDADEVHYSRWFTLFFVVLVLGIVPTATGFLKGSNLYFEPTAGLSFAYVVLLIALHCVLTLARWTRPFRLVDVVVALASVAIVGIVWRLSFSIGEGVRPWHLYLPILAALVLIAFALLRLAHREWIKTIHRYSKVMGSLVILELAIFGTLFLLEPLPFVTPYALAGWFYVLPLLAITVIWTFLFLWRASTKESVWPKETLQFLYPKPKHAPGWSQTLFQRGCHPAFSLGWIMIAGFVIWNVSTIPSVYNEDKPASILADQTRHWLDLEGSPEKTLPAIQLQTSLTVTVVNLDNPTQGNYLCYQGRYGSACPRITSDNRFLISHDTSEVDYGHISEAILASGSPFPLFPHKKIPEDKLEEIPELRQLTGYVDGGYLHSLPIQAALLVDSDQALVISAATIGASEKDPSPQSRWIGAMAAGLPRVLSTMFQGSQGLDLLSAGDMLVVQISSVLSRKQLPFLGNFSQGQAETMYNMGNTDKERRYRVISWGPPRRRSPLGRHQYSLYAAVHFSPNSCRPLSYGNRLASLLELFAEDNWQKLRTISVTGYADNIKPTGTSRKVDSLAQLRAMSVACELKKSPALRGTRVRVCVGGMGGIPTKPANDFVQRQLDRRVEITAGIRGKGCLTLAPIEDSRCESVEECVWP